MKRIGRQHLEEVFQCLWRLRPYLRGGRYLVLAVVAGSLAAAALEGVGVSLLVPLLSLLLNGEGTAPMRPIEWLQRLLPNHGPAYYILVFCFVVLGAIVTKNVVFYFSQVLAARLKRRMTINLRQSLFQHFQSADLSVFEQHTSGGVVNAFLTETGRTFAAIDAMLALLQRGCISLVYLAVLLVISWPLTLLSLLIAGGIGTSITFLYRRLSRRGHELSALNRRLGAFLVESFFGMRVIRAVHAQARMSGRFADLNEQQARVEEDRTKAISLLQPVTEVAAIFGAVLLVGAAYVFLVHPRLMLPSHLLGFGFILLRLLSILNQIYNTKGHLLYMASGIVEVERWLQTPRFPIRHYGVRTFSGVDSAIRFEEVGFVYANGTRALRQVSFTLPAGKTVAVVGESGSGKSTIAALLLRFRAPTEGRITVDGTDYWEFGPASWHRAVAIVEQDTFLFHDTLAYNIAFGFPEASNEALQEAIRLAHLEDVVLGLPQGLDTVVGERGNMLSGGQRQRLAIARTLVRNPRVLILDEATSALDAVSEQRVQEAIESASHGRTVLIIAHRLSTIRRADQIVVLEKGEVSECGTWEELVASRGHFHGYLKAAALSAR